LLTNTQKNFINISEGTVRITLPTSSAIKLDRARADNTTGDNQLRSFR